METINFDTVPTRRSLFKFVRGLANFSEMLHLHSSIDQRAYACDFLIRAWQILREQFNFPSNRLVEWLKRDVNKKLAMLYYDTG